MSCQEQINRLLVVIHHENIHELASLRFLNRPWHDAQAIAHARAITHKKEAWVGDEKPTQRQSCVG